MGREPTINSDSSVRAQTSHDLGIRLGWVASIVPAFVIGGASSAAMGEVVGAGMVEALRGGRKSDAGSAVPSITSNNAGPQSYKVTPMSSTSLGSASESTTWWAWERSTPSMDGTPITSSPAACAAATPVGESSNATT